MPWFTQIKRPFIITLLTVIAPYLCAAKQSNHILIRNIILVDRSSKNEDKNVNIYLKNSRLSILSVDEIILKEGAIGYEANKGFLLGTLNIGELANFMILKQDPRADIQVLLDTKTHITFAIRDGSIVQNTLTPITEPDSDSMNGEKKKTNWLAYTPPPMALPLTYDDKSKWNQWESKPTSGIFIAAVAIDRHHWLTQNYYSRQQVGELKPYDGGEIRAFRFGIAGTINFKKPWFYTLVGATHAFDKGYNSIDSDKLTILDYRLDIPLWQEISLSVGKQKEPISMERLLLGTQMTMQERSAIVDAMFPVRNVGISVNGNSFNKRTSWAVGVFNDWFDASQTFKESDNQVIGRLTGLPLLSKDESSLLHLGIGLRYTEGKENIHYQVSPEFNQSPTFVNTDTLDADGALTSDFELTWKHGPFWLSSEFIFSNVETVGSGNPVFSGYYLSGSWIITGETRKYNKRNGTMGPVPVSRSVYQGGAGAWEIAMRYSSIDFNKGIIKGGEMNIFSLGLNWWLTPLFGVSFNYRNILLDRNNLLGQSSGFMGRVVLVLE